MSSASDFDSFTKRVCADIDDNLLPALREILSGISDLKKLMDTVAELRTYRDNIPLHFSLNIFHLSLAISEISLASERLEWVAMRLSQNDREPATITKENQRG